MGGGVAVQEFPGGPVDVVDAASDQDGLHPPAWRTGGSGAGVSGKGGAPLVVPLPASGGRAEAGQARWGVGCGGRRIVDEMEYYVRTYGIKEVEIFDDIFN